MCGLWTIARLFDGRAASLKLFRSVKRYALSLGAVKVRAAKTMVLFSAGAGPNFAYVWLPQLWVKGNPESSITLSFILPRRVRHPGIKKSLEPYPGRWMHHMVIAKESDFGSGAKKWLREAYEFGRSRA